MVSWCFRMFHGFTSFSFLFHIEDFNFGGRFFCPIDTANLVHPGAFLAPRFDNTLNGLLKSGGDEVSDGSDPAPIWLGWLGWLGWRRWRGKAFYRRFGRTTLPVEPLKAFHRHIFPIFPIFPILPFHIFPFHILHQGLTEQRSFQHFPYSRRSSICAAASGTRSPLSRCQEMPGMLGQDRLEVRWEAVISVMFLWNVVNLNVWLFLFDDLAKCVVEVVVIMFGLNEGDNCWGGQSFYV